MSKLPYFDRDLSWLSFNYRVLLEAQKSEVPLLERLRFIAIYSSNLDEFFRVRVASLRRLVAIGKKKINKKLNLNPQEIINSIHKEVDHQLEEYGQTLIDVLDQLRKNGIDIHKDAELPAKHKEELLDYFKTRLLAFLQPQLLKSETVPFLKNKALYFGLRLRQDEKRKYAILNIPSDKNPRFYSIKEETTTHVYFIDDIIRAGLKWVFPDYEILECRSIKLNKDADLQIDDEFQGDLVAKIEKQVKKRDLGDPSRFLYDSEMSNELLETFRELYQLDEEDLVSGGRYHNLNDFFQVKNTSGNELEYEPLTPIRNREIDTYESLFQAADEKDQILHFPYQSYDYVLRFFNEAAIDPGVKEINVTFYRMAERSVIGDALISASKNGKSVNVFMEVKARFDEENNLRWAQMMREAGVNIQYSMPGLKVHAKVALVRKEVEGQTKFYGFFGTGNLNENTAKIYCDHGLLTSHQQMTQELEQVFRYLNKQQEPKGFNHLIVSQFGALERFSELIDREIQNHRNGLPAKILIKLNNLEEPNLIARLYEAAAAGVPVKVITRSICCMVPETNGIEVSRIVDRYLEHARLFYFHNAGEEKLFTGSSDWMNRNLHRRVEVTFPVHDPEIKAQLLKILELQLSDNTSRVSLDERMKNIFVEGDEKPINAQKDTYSYLKSFQ